MKRKVMVNLMIVSFCFGCVMCGMVYPHFSGTAFAAKTESADAKEERVFRKEVLQKLDKLIANQEAIRQELDIVKIRASRR